MKHQAHSTRYRNPAGKIQPSVTTITAMVAKPALIHSAWKLGIDDKDYREVWGEAAKIGTVTHYLVECFLKELKPDLSQFVPEHVKVAKHAFEDFPSWWKSEGFTLVDSEHKMVSETMGVGGTMDIIAEDALEELWNVDIKTSSGIYDEMLYQQAAYWAMWNEENPDRPLHGVILVHLDKGSGALTPHKYLNLFRELEIFRHLRMIYGLMKREDKARLARIAAKLNLERI